jgi:hypothetical protein
VQFDFVAGHHLAGAFNPDVVVAKLEWLDEGDAVRADGALGDATSFVPFSVMPKALPVRLVLSTLNP